MATLHSLQKETIHWVHDPYYQVTESTYRKVDYRRKCWICGGGLKVGDYVTVVGTDTGVKLVHSACYREQMPDESA